MGCGFSKRQGVLYLATDDTIHKIAYDRMIPVRTLEEQIALAIGFNRLTNLVLRGKGGQIVALSPTMPDNSSNEPYTVELAGYSTCANDVVGSTVKEVGKQFHKVFMVDDIKKEIMTKLGALEKRIDKEGRRLVEMEKYKLDLVELRDSIYNKSTNTLDYNRLRPSITLPEHFYCPSTEREALLNMQRDIPSFEKYSLSEQTKQALKHLTFDVWQWEPNEMLVLLEEMFYGLNLVEELNIHPATLKRFLLRVQENYRNNPFHNFRHCFCVTQMMYVLIHQCKLQKHLSKRDICVLLTACICHDLDHPGFNNTYQINARTEIAVRYNDMSPLENHHCAMSFKILSQPECNIFANCSADVFKEIRGDMIVLILATDMARHAEILDAFKQKVDNFDFSSEDHLTSLKMILIKACDVSNECRPFMISEHWVECLLEEYFHQSDKEKKDGLPIAPFMDRDRVTKATAQIGFIRFVLLPLFESLNTLFPELEEISLQNLRNALKHYENLKEREEQSKKEKSL